MNDQPLPPDPQPPPLPDVPPEVLDKADRLVERGNVYYQESQYARAEQSFQRALEAIPDYAPALAGLALIQRLREKLRQRLEHIVSEAREGRLAVAALRAEDLAGYDVEWPEVAQFRRDLTALEEAAARRRAVNRRRILAWSVAASILVPLAAGAALYLRERAAFAPLSARYAAAAPEQLELLRDEIGRYLDARVHWYQRFFVAQAEEMYGDLEARIDQRDFARVEALAAGEDTQALLDAIDAYLLAHPVGAHVAAASQLREQTLRAAEEREFARILALPAATERQLQEQINALRAFAAAHPSAEWQTRAAEAEQQLREAWHERQYAAAETAAAKALEQERWTDARAAWAQLIQTDPPEPWKERAQAALEGVAWREAEAVLEALRRALPSLPPAEAEKECARFLARFEDTPSAATVRHMLDDIRLSLEAEAFAELERALAATDSASRVEQLAKDYLRRFPNSPHRAALQERLDAIQLERDHADFAAAVERARAANTDSERRRIMQTLYLDRYPQGAHVEQARQIAEHGYERSEQRLVERVEELLQQTPLDEAAILQAAEDYAALYPAGEHIAQMRAVGRQIRDALEQRAYQAVLEVAKSGDPQRLLRFIHDYETRFPDGAHLAEVATLRTQALAGIEERAWQELQTLYARREQDPEAYMEAARWMLVRYPDTPRRAEIEAAIAETSAIAHRFWMARARAARERFEWRKVAAAASQALQHVPGDAEAERLLRDAIANGRFDPRTDWAAEARLWRDN